MTRIAPTLLLFLAANAPVTGQAPAPKLRVPYVHDTLPNGLTLQEARSEIEKRFAAWWTAAGSSAAATGTAQPTSHPTTVYLVDKPGAAQSVVRIGHRGVERGSPDYYAIQVMNTLLGGSFSSRLNSNLRETKGYTYGARSSFDYQPVPGAFTAAADVRTDVSDSSLVEFFVGDIQKIRPGIERLGLGPVEIRKP